MSIYLKNLAHYHPDHIVDNHFLKGICDADPAWVLSKTGIIERRSMTDYQGDLPGYELLRRLIAKWKSEALVNDWPKIDLIISAASHDDLHYPNPGNLIAKDEGLVAPVFQLKSACTSVAYAVFLARSVLSTTFYNDVLVLNAEAFTRYVDYGDRRSCILFGDAASMLFVSKESGAFQLIDVDIGGQGLDIVQELRTSDTSHLTINEMATGELQPGKPRVNRRKRSEPKFQQDGRAVVEFVLTQMPSKIELILRKNNLTLAQVDHVVLHQSNLVMMAELIDRVGLPQQKHLYNVDRFGNTSSSGWVTVLSQNQSKIKPNAIVLVSVFGAGMTWSNILLKRTSESLGGPINQ